MQTGSSLLPPLLAVFRSSGHSLKIYVSLGQQQMFHLRSRPVQVNAPIRRCRCMCKCHAPCSLPALTSNLQADLTACLLLCVCVLKYLRTCSTSTEEKHPRCILAFVSHSALQLRNHLGNGGRRQEAEAGGRSAFVLPQASRILKEIRLHTLTEAESIWELKCCCFSSDVFMKGRWRDGGREREAA